MVYTCSISVTLGNSRYDSHVRRFRAYLGILPGVNRVVAVLPSRVPCDAAPGDDAIVELGAGDTTETILTGTIKSLERDFLSISITMSDGSADLNALRPAQTFEQQASGDIIEALAGDASVAVSSNDASLDLAAFTADQFRTAAETIATLASLSNCIAYVNVDNELTVSSIPGRADSALRYGRDLLSCRVTNRHRNGPERIAIGNGPAGSNAAPNALTQSRDSLPSGAKSPGPSARWLPMAYLRTPTSTSNVSKALNATAERLLSTIEARCILTPGLTVGSVVQIQDCPDTTSEGPWLITGVCHESDSEGRCLTCFRGRAASSGAGSLFGGLF